MNIHELKHRWRTLGWDRKVLLSAALLSLIPVCGSLFFSSEPPPSASRARAAQVDTMIPKGFVLVPIEVQNYESLDSILGQFGIVDLLIPAGGDGQPNRLVARNVRILRAPQNPTHFAVLIRESEVPQILQQGGLFTVIVKRPEQGGTEIVKAQAKKRRKIVYEGG